ncbi:MAG: hypothetical protein EP343_04595 [Deltaproteobacteria bacterium]|nr:MAG: hypothetical protein EP343_04595 [Deltaproteobacteria bacterium]
MKWMKTLQATVLMFAVSSTLIACGPLFYTGPCETDDDCMNGAVCQTGACQASGTSPRSGCDPATENCSTTTQPSEGGRRQRTSCQSDADCGEGRACDMERNVCRRTCTNDGDCKSGTCDTETAFCKRSQTNAPACQSDADCGEGQKCSTRRNVCVQTCSSNVDCSDGKVCSSRSNVCVRPRDGSRQRSQ